MSRLIRIFTVCLVNLFFIPITELWNKEGGCPNLAVCPSIPDFTLIRVVLLLHNRYPYRGVMIDVARNFQYKESIFKLIDAMATYKLNKLHLHLSDDEGWRLEIPDLPELVEVRTVFL